MACSIVVYSFWHQIQSAIRFHHVGVQREGIITNKEIWSISIIIRQVVRRKDTNHTLLNSFLQATVFEYLCIRWSTIYTNFHTGKLVVPIYKDHQDYGVKVLIVEVV